MLWESRILIIGAGDRGTASALRLFKAGFRPLLLDRNNPTDLNYNRNFSDTVYLGEKEIDGIKSSFISNDPININFDKDINKVKTNRKIPFLASDDLEILVKIEPQIIIDCAGSFPKATKIEWEQFPFVIRIGTQFNLGVDGHSVIGDCGQSLGQVFSKPHNQIREIKENRELVTSPIEGVFISKRRIGDKISETDTIGTINDIQIQSPGNGIIKGLLHSGHFVSSRQPLFEIIPTIHFSEEGLDIPVKCHCIAGGVLEAVLSYLHKSNY